MDFKLPELGEGVYEAEAVRWLVKPGDAVKPGQALLEVLTDKATMEVPAPFAGVIDQLLVESGQKLKIGQAILQYGGQEAPPAKPAPTTDAKPKAAPVRAARDNGAPTAVKAAPSVRLMARKLGIDLAHVHGSGTAGRILVDDLARAAHPLPPAPLLQEERGAASSAPQDFGKPGTRIPFTGVRRKIAETMVEAKRTIPHYSYVDECDFSDLVKLREALKESFAKKGTKLTYVAFVLQAVVAALKEVPIVNASLDEKAGAIVLHDRYHIGVAVASPAGLIVPVVHDADKKSLFDLASDIERLSTDARQGKQNLDDLRGATFTVTSFGNVGGLFASPIVPPGQLGILGVGRIVKRPVFDQRGQVKAADMAYLSFSFDHRVLDGAVGAAFGNVVVKHLQNAAMALFG